VLWLDDLDEARLGRLTPALLDRLRSEVVVVASMTTQRRDRITRGDSDIGRAARLALARATEIHLSTELTDEEHDTAEVLYPRERFDHSIGEPLVAADHLTAKFNAGRTDNPVGHALVRAAIDWRRAGLSRPIGTSDLQALYAEYLPSVRAGLEPSDDLYEAGLAWACEPLASHVALLEKVMGDTEHGFLAFDYLVALLDGQHGYPRREVPPFIWRFIVDTLSEEDALTSGVTAYLRGDRGGAKHIWEALAGGSSVRSGEAAFNLGVLLGKEGDRDSAMAAYQLAIESGHEEVAPMAAHNFVNLLEEDGAKDSAKAALQLATESGHEEVAPRAAFKLGTLLKREGDKDGARAALQLAIESGHEEVALKAAFDLRELLEEEEGKDGARVALQLAVDSGHDVFASIAAFSLGGLLEEEGDREGARTAYRLAVDSGHDVVAPWAAFSLGALLEKEGDRGGAKGALQLAVDSGHEEVAPQAAFSLGTLLQEEGDKDGARDAYRLAVESGRNVFAADAAFRLGVLLEEEGDKDGARDAYRLAVGSSYRHIALPARHRLMMMDHEGTTR
jgi:tetratricopeptide (TPR) repeat protein